MTKWEYAWVRPGELSPRIMNEYGEAGWEYAGTLGNDWTIFKRLKPIPIEEQLAKMLVE